MITIRSATKNDLDGIMDVEAKKWEEGTAATREVMARRIEICNSKEPHHFFVTVEDDAITGYLVMQPTNLTPETCISWTSATDNGTMEKTYDSDGTNLYIVSIGAISPPKASAETADRIIARVMDMWCQHGGVIMFTARMPGFATAHEKTGISAEEYWQLKKTDGSPLDAGIQFYWARAGHVFPERLLKDGFPTDTRSGGHAVLFVLRDILRGQEGIQNHLTQAARHEGRKLGRRQKKSITKPQPSPQIAVLDGGGREWWDITKNDFVQMHTLYIPQGCDWKKCTFCSIPHAVDEYEKTFFNGARVPKTEIVTIFGKTLNHMIATQPKVHTLCLFNVGSFLSDVSNPPSVRKQLINLACQTPGLSRIIIEARASDVTEKNMHELCSELGLYDIDLTVRSGVETQHEILRQKYLKKGQSDRAFRNAVRIIHKYGALVGGYVLLHPAPFSTMRLLLGSPEETEENILLWAEEEALRTLDFVLGKPPYNLGMDEAYFCSTNVGPNTVLTEAWKEGDFNPAPLHIVCNVLRKSTTEYGPRIHMLPFKDERTFLAVPSNHVREGIAQDLSNALGCDKRIHAMLNTYRATMNPHFLVDYHCECDK